MSTYTADYKDGNIVLKNGNNTQKINITTLLLNNGNSVTTGKDFEYNQQELNYLDSIKDGTDAYELQNFRTFPKSGEPPFTKLKKIENTIEEEKKKFLTPNSWLKFSKDSERYSLGTDKNKNYQNIFYESGLKHYAYVNNPNDVNTINTFGSYIDPLDKGDAKEVWPSKNNSINLTEGFMELFGYGKSSIKATTINQQTFDYEMKIKCGVCEKVVNNPCILTYKNNKQIGGIKNEKTKKIMPNEFFFLGNNEKSKFLTESGNELGKNVFVVMKGWGDKVQVLIFFMYYHFINKSSVITSNDLVVFTLCMILSVPCIYIGKPDIQEDDKSKYRSIIEYKPSSDPYDDKYAYETNVLDKIYKENEKFIGTIQYLIEKPNIKIGEEKYIFKKQFYEEILKDITKIQTDLKKETTKFEKNYKKKGKGKDNKRIEELQKVSKEIKQKYLLVPFIKIKKGTTTDLTILMTKSYTAQLPCDNTKPSIQKYLRVNRSIELSSLSFLEIGLKYFRNNLTVGGSNTPDVNIDIDTSKFHKDEVDYIIDNKTNDIEVDYTNNTEKDYTNYSMKYDEYFEKEYTTFSDEENNDEKYNLKKRTNKINLLKNLTESFETTMREYQTKYKINDDIFNYLSDTIYTLYVYESYLNGYCSIEFNQTILKNILKEYKLLITIRYTRRLFNFWSTNKTRKIRSNQPHKTDLSKTPSKDHNINFENGINSISPTSDKQKIIYFNYILPNNNIINEKRQFQTSSNSNESRPYKK